MLKATQVSTCALPPHLAAWRSLVTRSIAAWDHILPGDDQAELAPQSWEYIWVDWTCAPQSPRSEAEQAYFHRCRWTMSGIIQNCGFIYFYPPFEARLWILYEVAESGLTSSGSQWETDDVKTYGQHVNEMFKIGVQNTLRKYGYRCSQEYDWQFLTSWLEMLVILRKLHLPLGIISFRRILNCLTWYHTAGTVHNEGVELKKWEGILMFSGRLYTFKPFPR